MHLLVGLGNPGSQHAGNRHNIGFLALDAIHRRHNFAPWRKRFAGDTADGSIEGARVILLKPLTFMNESGRSVGEAASFFKLSEAAVTVLHDEIDLAPGKVRVKTGGGIAGHNGLRSISAHIGNDYARVRIGVGHPGVKELVHRHVLSDFAKAERPWVEALCDAIADNIGLLTAGRDGAFQSKVHLALEKSGTLPVNNDETGGA